MNLLKEISDANEKAWTENPGYKGPLNGFGGKGSSLVWGKMSVAAQKKWDEQQWPRELVTHPEVLKTWASKFGKDIINM